MALPRRSIPVISPDKGSFPIDRECVCEDLVKQYMSCLKDNSNNRLHSPIARNCHDFAKQYLKCRMDNNLMAKESWVDLGFKESEGV